MEHLVGRYNFMTAGHDQREDFSKDQRFNRDKYEAVVNEDDILGAFKLLRKGVCRPDFPGESSDQYYFANDVLESLISWAVKLQESGKITSLSRIHDFCFDFLHDLIQQGPGTTHMQLWMEMFSGRDFEFRKYYHDLSGDRLKSHLRFLMREYRSREPGPDRERFDITFDSAERCLVGDDRFRKESFKEAQSEFIELYIYTELSKLSRPREIRVLHLNRNVFENLDDPRLIKHFLKRLEEVICSLNLSTETSQKDVKTVTDVVKKLFTAIKQAALFHKVYVEVLDFLTVICDKKAGSPIHPIVTAVGSLFCSASDNPTIKGNSELFTVMTTKLTVFLTDLEDHTLMRMAFADEAVYHVLKKAMNKSPEHCQLMFDLIKACLRIHQPMTAKAAKYAVQENEKFLKWKDHIEDATEILDLLMKVRVFGGKSESEEFAGFYNAFARKSVEQIKRDRVIHKVVGKMVEFCLKILERREARLFETADEVASSVTFSGKKDKDLIMSTFANLRLFLTDPNYPWDDSGARYPGKVVVKLASRGMEALESKSMNETDFNALTYFLKTAMKGNFIEEESNSPCTVFYNLYYSVGSTFLTLLDDQEKVQRAILVVREIVNLLLHEFEEVIYIATSQISTLTSNGARVMATFFPQIMEAYLHTENLPLLYSLGTIYPYYPRLTEPQFQTLFELIDTTHRNNVIHWFPEIAKKQPNLFTDDMIGKLIEEMFHGDEKIHITYLMIMNPLSKKKPQIFLPHLKTLVTNDVNTQYGAIIQLVEILKNVAIWRKDEALAEEVMAYLEKHIRGPEDQFATLSCLNEMRAIGGVYRPLLERRKPAIEDLRKRSTTQATKDQCNSILDVLEGRSLESLAEEIRDVKEDVEELDTRVTRTEVGLVLLSKEVGEQREELKGVKVDVKKQGKKVVRLEKTVDDTKAKVEELDGKTLSHAPFWARDVAKLLNPEDLLDWTLLSMRLGYTNDDIRSWAQMHDPCMAMLNEWYATRKTREATYAVLTALQEMDRLDAAVIVENAMKMTEAVVEDEEFEYPEPPEVFISYQWGIQNEVKLLKQHLGKAGFTCWMDIGQMGGGDKLFEKIDKGIRAAKLVICCVTGKYAKSPNCNREVNLSVSLGKPIIPLLMEKLSWPPPGSMGPIFSEYLFIRFFTRPGEETGDIRYWSAAKFQELLMQVNYNNVKPDEQKVEKEYKNWWCPVAEVITIDKKDVKTMTAASQQKQEEVERGSASPDVFISYQWGKQKQVQLMYKRLTEMGFTVWMDIYQMGGGDSLYDKIDKGVRGAKVVLSCVTTKYSLSANCRREVSLADALKKPIVPLLLEKMTWPPSGPMSMVFTQLLYINFGKDETVQERWDGDKFDELLTKLDQYVPDIITLYKGETLEEPFASTEEVADDKEDTPPSSPLLKEEQNKDTEQIEQFQHHHQSSFQQLPQQQQPLQQQPNWHQQPHQQPPTTQQQHYQHQPHQHRQDNQPPQWHHPTAQPHSNTSKSCSIL
ncbi:uncharacterized protein LOC124288997 [Haliotis rubra]|uniref:uncharacterized protein LOC124288997 n=1 Tax=Haliotis rubra TaxID=36100 RepID=UPI001EE5923B|nr:uncharacterized protein LOC124288997 [Haliotis rubra]